MSRPEAKWKQTMRADIAGLSNRHLFDVTFGHAEDYERLYGRHLFYYQVAQEELEKRLAEWLSCRRR